MKTLINGFMWLAVLFLSGCMAEITATEHLENAKSFLDDQQTANAVIELKSVLQKNPRNLEARFILGNLYLDMGDGAGAEKELSQALVLSENDFITHLLARALLLQNNYKAVRDLQPEKNLPTEDIADLTVSKGMALLALGMKKEARFIFEQAVTSNTDSTYALEGLAKLAFAEGQMGESRKLAEKILKIDNQYAQAWSLIGKIDAHSGNLESAETAFTSAIRHRKTLSIEDLLNRLLVRIGLNKIDEAEEDLYALSELPSDSPAKYYAKGLIHFHKKEFDLAQAEFEKVLSKTNNYLPALLYSGAANLNLGNEIIAEHRLDKYVAELPNFAPANNMLAAIKLRKGEYNRAEQLLFAALHKTPNDVTALSLLAELQFAQKKGPEALTTLQKLETLQPDSANVKTALGQGLLQQGDINAATDAFNSAIAIDPTYAQAYARLTRIYLNAGAYEKALATAEQYRIQSKESASAYKLLGFVYLGLNNEAKAIESFEEVLEKTPGDISANSGLAAIAIGSKNHQKAISHYQNILNNHPENLQTLLNLAEAYLAQNNNKLATQILQQAIEHHPQEVRPRFRLAWVYARSDEVDRIPEVLAGMRKKHPDNVPLLRLLADTYHKLKRYAEAQELLLQLEALRPRDDGIQYSLAKTYAAQGYLKNYQTTLEKTLDLNPEHIGARLELTNFLLSARNTSAAQAHLDVLNVRLKGTAEVLLLEAKLAEIKGDFKAAAEAYRQIYSYTKNNFNLIRLSNALWKANRQDEALSLLEQWLEKHPQDDIIHLELANRYLSLQRDEAALAGFTKVIELSPDNSIALNNLAWQLRETNNKRALQYAEQALEQEPESIAVMDTLAMVLLSKGGQDDKIRATRLIERASEAQPSNLTFQYHSALVDVSNRKKSSAIKKLQSLLANNKDFPERAEAERLLKELQ